MKIIRFLSLLIGITAASAACIYAKNISLNTNQEIPIELEADRLEFNKEKNTLFAVGNVKAFQGAISIRSESLILYIDEERVEAFDHIEFDQGGGSVLYGEFLSFNYKSSTGTLTPGSGQQGYWKYSGKKFDKISEDKIRIYRSRFTTCDQNPPHYYIFGTRATVRLKKWIYVRNAFLVVDKTPIFYTPVFFTSLRDKKISIHVKPGYSKDDGIKLLTEIGYPTSDETYLKFLIDYYELKGTGKGAEFDYATDNAKGSIYGYTIKEHDRNTNITEERWEFLLNHWQRYDVFDSLPDKDPKTGKNIRKPELTSQAQFEFQSDTNFNNDFQKDAYKRINQELKGSAAVTYNSELGTARLSADRTDTFNQTKNDFEINSLTVPGFEYYLNRRRIAKGLPLYMSFNSNFRRNYTQSNDYYQNIAGAGMSIGNDIRLTRFNTFTHTYGWIENWYDGVRQAGTKDTYQGKYTVDLNLHNRIISWIDFDLSQGYTVRMRPNSTIQMTENTDKGIERNLMSGFLIMRPTKYFTSRTSSGYDFHRDRNERVTTIVQKMSSVTEEINFTQSGVLNSSYFARSSYSPLNHWMETLQLGYSINPTKYYSFGLNSSYNKSSRGIAVFSGTTKLTLFEYWYLRGSLGFKAIGPNRTNYNKFDFYDRELEIVRDMHCFILSMLYRLRGTTEEVLFSLQLKFEYLKKRKIEAQMHSYEFYPWRDK